MSKLQLVSITSSDKLTMPGLLYTPKEATKKAAIWLHGMGDTGTFYSPPRINALGNSLTSKNIALLTFNNRGAHNAKTLRIDDESLPEDQRNYQGGTHFEKIADCVRDIDGAVAFLHKQGFSTLYLLGHSTGANKICAYHVRAKHNPFHKYVLAGPGDDSGQYYAELGNKKFWRAIEHAKQLIANNKPLHIMPLASGMHPFSAQSAFDILDPDGAYNTFPFYEETTERIGHKPLFEEYRTFDRPTMVVFGEQDEYATTAGGSAGACAILKKYLPTKIQADSAFELIKEADHSFHDHEAEFAEMVASWLAK
jgi:pimeloyl-ACP methyl ester carboxylesterase